MAIETNVTVDNFVFQGEDKLLDFTVYQADGGTPQDISAYSLEWLLVSDLTSETQILSKTSDVGGGITINSPNAVVTLTSANLAGIAAGSYSHILWRTNTGVKTVLAYGFFVLRDAPQP